MPTGHTRADAVILGGGLAGLTLAIHLRQRNPQMSVHVIERRVHPVREAAFKVGESTVEIGAHYLAEVLGLRDHLEACHVRKFGFRFFFNDQQEDIARCLELGVSRALSTPSWQIDRGRFENFLGQYAQSLGIRFDHGATVKRIDLADEPACHRVEYDYNGTKFRSVLARWVIDASGRAGLLKRKLGLARPNEHNANAAWWRVAGRIDLNEWSSDNDWLGRCEPPDRWRSTNHLCGPGYWVWLIPLASGSHSVGIVCDPRMHPLEKMNSHERAMQWMDEHQPQLARVLAQQQHAVQDFGYLRNYSYNCAQLLSEQRWAITGEAGLFLDPFYSPGTDFIAIANTYICDLVERNLCKEPIAARAQMYQQLLTSFYDNALVLYRDQYALFGDKQVMPIKIIWDYSYYWSVLTPLFFKSGLTDLALLSRLRSNLANAATLNLQMQALFAKWGQRNNCLPTRDGSVERLLDQHQICWFRQMNHELTTLHKCASVEKLIAANIARMEQLAGEIKSQFEQKGKGDSCTSKRSEQNCLERLLAAEWYTEKA